MSVYYMEYCYDEKTDEYFAIVDDRHGNAVFQIDTTEEVCDYIRTGRMNHIDDVKGLTAFMVAQECIKPEDTVILVTEAIDK